MMTQGLRGRTKVIGVSASPGGERVFEVWYRAELDPQGFAGRRNAEHEKGESKSMFILGD